MAFTSGPLPARLKLYHGIGSIAFGVKDGGFSFFLLPFYNLVLGVDAGTVGAALATALVIDALIDPLIGHLSDRTYSRWGRRLPWLYLAPLPLALMWALLWSPPFTGVPDFGEIVALAVGVRLLLSACEVPSISLVPEITDDYDERTTLFRYRFLFAWIGGLMMMVMTFTVFLPTPEAQLREDGYAVYGAFGAVVILLTVIGSAIGQHRLVAQLPPRRPGPFSLRGAFAEIVEAFQERAFAIFVIGAVGAYIAQGVTFSITQYLNLYVWQFSDLAFKLYPLVLFVSVVVMFLAVGPLNRRWGKPRTAAFAALAGLALFVSPFLLLLAGAWPEPGTTASTALLFGFLICANTASVTSLVSATSMVAEVVEAFEQRTGKRAEGTFFAGNWLVQKCATGAGILISSLIVQSIDLAPGTPQNAVSPEMIRRLLWMVPAVMTALILFAAFWLARFPITREDHQARVAGRRQGGDPLGDVVRTDPDGNIIIP